MDRRVYCFVFLLFSLISSYPIDKSTLSVSGLSSGGFMAVQYHVAYSSEVVGSGVFAGGPYYCAQGQLSNAFTNCMYGLMLDVNKLISLTKTFSSKGDIEDIANLTNAKVYLYSGNKDSVVYPAVMKATETYYKAFTNSGGIKTNFNTPSEHCMPTESCCNTCSYKGSPYINNCNMDGAGETLKWIYGTLKPKVTPIKSNIISISQSKFLPSGWTTSSLSLSSTAYAYVPSGCRAAKQGDEKCRIHVVFHGCLQTTTDIGDQYYTKTGYNDWAEANKIVILYPQAAKSSFMPSNPNGCWDWWGYASQNYAFKEGPQLQMVRNMIDSLVDK